ncbi:hypothetical protein D9M69_667580 [compost metagenome]
MVKVMALASTAVSAFMWPGTTSLGLSEAISSSWATQAARSAALCVSAVHTCMLPKTPMLPTTALIDGIQA